MRTLAILALLLVAAPRAHAEEPKVSAKVKKHFGENAVQILAGATKVEVFRVESKPGAKPGPDDKTVAGFRITATGKEQDAKFAAKVASVVLNEKSYIWDAAKGCIFQPGVAFRVWKGDESVIIVICFSCDQVQVLTADKDGKLGKPVWGESDPGRPGLVKLAKAALPDDKDIQKLKEQRD